FEIYKKRHLFVSLCFVIRYRFKTYKNEHIHDSKFLITRVYFGQKLQLLKDFTNYNIVSIKPCLKGIYSTAQCIGLLDCVMNYISALQAYF
ncbi:MAG: hypothetical protein N4A49_11275, partial [Marinifilaceae bacterium]|nr:hypothetical protein [Marinifilaceae bacterium]